MKLGITADQKKLAKFVRFAHGHKWIGGIERCGYVLLGKDGEEVGFVGNEWFANTIVTLGGIMRSLESNNVENLPEDLKEQLDGFMEPDENGNFKFVPEVD